MRRRRGSRGSPVEVLPGEGPIADAHRDPTGGIVVGIVLGALGNDVIAPMTDLRGRATLLPVLWAGIGGIILGAAVALAIAFRDEPARLRFPTVLMVLVPGVLLFVRALSDLVDVPVVHPLTPAVLLPVLAPMGRFVATRDDDRQDAACSDRRRSVAHQRTMRIVSG